MADKVTITGSFYDVYNRPLTGKVYFEPHPAYVVHQPDDSVYTGKVAASLDAKGAISAELIASKGWNYKITFQLWTIDGVKANMDPVYANFAASGSLPDLLELKVAPGSSEPALVFAPGADEGTVVAINATADPNDAGAILVPLETTP